MSDRPKKSPVTETEDQHVGAAEIGPGEAARDAVILGFPELDDPDDDFATKMIALKGSISRDIDLEP